MSRASGVFSSNLKYLVEMALYTSSLNHSNSPFVEKASNSFSKSVSKF